MFQVHNLVGIQLNNTKLGQVTNLDVIFYIVVLIYKLDQSFNSPQSPAQPQSGLYLLDAFASIWGLKVNYDKTEVFGLVRVKVHTSPLPQENLYYGLKKRFTL